MTVLPSLPFPPDREQPGLEAIRRFWRGEGRYLFSFYPEEHDYRKRFSLYDILTEAPHHLRLQSRMPGVRMPTFWADWGTISTALYWGGKTHFDSTGGNIFIDPAAETLDEALNRNPMAVEEPTLDAAKAISIYRELQRRMPGQSLWLRTPDMQGPLNTAGLILRQEALFAGMYDDPEKVEAFLEKVTDFLIRYARFLRVQTDDRVCGNIWPYAFLPGDMGLALTEDMMPLLSPKHYKRFGLPALQRLNREFGGLLIHCCGAYRQHVPVLAQSGLNILGLEFHYPDMRLEDLEPLADRTVLVPYIDMHKTTEFASPMDFYRHLIDHADPKYRFWFAVHTSEPATLAAARRLGIKG